MSKTCVFNYNKFLLEIGTRFLSTFFIISIRKYHVHIRPVHSSLAIKTKYADK